MVEFLDGSDRRDGTDALAQLGQRPAQELQGPPARYGVEWVEDAGQGFLSRGSEVAERPGEGIEVGFDALGSGNGIQARLGRVGALLVVDQVAGGVSCYIGGEGLQAEQPVKVYYPDRLAVDVAHEVALYPRSRHPGNTRLEQLPGLASDKFQGAPQQAAE